MVWAANKAPDQTTDEGKDLAQWVEDELERFQNEQNDNLQALDLRPIFAGPLRPRQGMIIYADGTTYNPGGGEGPYYRNAAGLWVPMSGSEILYASRNYYVRSDGSDANSGLVDSAAGAMLTIQAVIAKLYRLNFNGQSVTVFVRAGTYAPFVVFGPWPGNGFVTIEGDTTTPANVIISGTGISAIRVQDTTLFLKGLKVQTTGAGTNGLQIERGGSVYLSGKMEFGACGLCWILCTGYSTLTTFVNLGFSGNAPFGIYMSLASTFDAAAAGVTWTILANINAAFVSSYYTSVCNINAGNVTITVAPFTVTGKRFDVGAGGIIATGGGGINYFPGTIAGTGTNFSVAPWGLYT